jgi:hypothetical protein
METPIEKTIQEFERLKNEATSIKDAIYLDGVLAVLDSFKEYEKSYIQDNKFTLEDLKKAYDAGGSVVSWSDFGFNTKWKSFDEWFDESYLNRK